MPVISRSRVIRIAAVLSMMGLQACISLDPRPGDPMTVLSTFSPDHLVELTMKSGTHVRLQEFVIQGDSIVGVRARPRQMTPFSAAVSDVSAVAVVRFNGRKTLFRSVGISLAVIGVAMMGMAASLSGGI